MSTMAKLHQGKPVMIDYTPAVSYNAGDVVVVGDMPLVAHQDNPAWSGGPIFKGALSCEGGVYVMTAAGAVGVGQDVWWDSSAQKVTTTAVGNTHFGQLVAGPTLVASDAGPANSGDSCLVFHNPKAVPGNGLYGAGSEATQSTTATLTAAQILGGLINSAPAGAITLTLPTAANMVAGMKGCKVGDRFACTLENTAGGANTITLAAGGATLRGGTAVAQNKSALLMGLITNVGAGTEAYTVHSLIGA